jgi:hypothetical protein
VSSWQGGKGLEAAELAAALLPAEVGEGRRATPTGSPGLAVQRSRIGRPRLSKSTGWSRQSESHPATKHAEVDARWVSAQGEPPRRPTGRAFMTPPFERVAWCMFEAPHACTDADDSGTPGDGRSTCTAGTLRNPNPPNTLVTYGCEICSGVAHDHITFT